MQMIATPSETQEPSNEDSEPQEEEFPTTVYSGKLRANKSSSNQAKVQASRRRALIKGNF
jgi:hypothetical protein